MTSARYRRSSIKLSMLVALWLPLHGNAAEPLAPNEFRYSIYSDSTAELFWERTTNTPVQGYELSRNGEVLGVFDALSYLDSSLTPGTDYTFIITAIGADGERSAVSTIRLITPQSADTIASLQRQIGTLEAEIESLQDFFNEGYLAPAPQSGMRSSILPGDDGDLQAGLVWPEPRFTLNVNASDDTNENSVCDGNENCNGAVTDQLTGLVWLQNASCFSGGDWSKSIDDSNALAGDNSSSCGLSDNSEAGDWRLPNLREIQSILDYGQSIYDDTLPAGHPFNNTRRDRYWTSTSIGPDDDDGAYALAYQGTVERLGTEGTDFVGYAWPVRDRQ